MGYLSVPLSPAGGGNFDINSEVAASREGGDREAVRCRLSFMFSIRGRSTPTCPRAAGADYMLMWTTVLEGPDGLGDFDFVYFAGPQDFARYFKFDGNTDMAKLDAFYDNRAKTDPKFEKAVAGGLTRPVFRRYYALRASASVSRGAHDEWNIFRLLNERRRADGKLGAPNQIPGAVRRAEIALRADHETRRLRRLRRQVRALTSLPRDSDGVRPRRTMMRSNLLESISRGIRARHAAQRRAGEQLLFRLRPRRQHDLSRAAAAGRHERSGAKAAASRDAMRARGEYLMFVDTDACAPIAFVTGPGAPDHAVGRCRSSPASRRWPPPKACRMGRPAPGKGIHALDPRRRRDSRRRRRDAGAAGGQGQVALERPSDAQDCALQPSARQVPPGRSAGPGSSAAPRRPPRGRWRRALAMRARRGFSRGRDRCRLLVGAVLLYSALRRRRAR